MTTLKVHPKFAKILDDLSGDLTALEEALLDEEGNEINNPKPHFIDAGLRRPPTLQEQLRRLIRVDLSRMAEQQAMESWEDANDFDIEDQFTAPMPDTVYQMQDDYPVSNGSKPAANPGVSSEEETTSEGDRASDSQGNEAAAPTTGAKAE